MPRCSSLCPVTVRTPQRMLQIQWKHTRGTQSPLGHAGPGTVTMADSKKTQVCTPSLWCSMLLCILRKCERDGITQLTGVQPISLPADFNFPSAIVRGRSTKTCVPPCSATCCQAARGRASVLTQEINSLNLLRNGGVLSKVRRADHFTLEFE